MTHPHPRALEAAYEAAAKIRLIGSGGRLNDPDVSESYRERIRSEARAAVTAYLQSAPPEIRIGQFVIRHAPKGIWIGRTDGEGGEFGTEQVEHAIAQFYRANF